MSDAYNEAFTPDDIDDIHINDVPEHIKQSVANDPRIAEADKDNAAKMVFAHLKAKDIDTDSSTAQKATPILIGALGAALLTMPRESEAFVGDFINAIIEDAISPILSLLETLQQGASSMFDDFISGASESNATAQTAAADAQNTVRVRIENQRLKAATAPTPRTCESDTVAKDAMESEAKSKAEQRVAIEGLVRAGMVNDSNQIGADFKAQAQRHGTSGGNLNIYSINKEDGISTEEEHRQATDFLKNVVSVDTRSKTNSQINQTLAQGYESVAYRQMADKAKNTTRRQIAMMPLIQAKTENDSRNGPSVRGALKAEVERTYGSTSEGWRAEIRGYADPTPLLAELNINTALSNHLLLKQYEKIVQGTLVDSVNLLEQLEG